MIFNIIVRKFKNRWKKFCLQPIRVFVFHQVSDCFDEKNMWPCDWTQTEVFKNNILKLQNDYKFISLEEAYHYIRHNKFRHRKFAVLTSDDGWTSLLNILPWINEQNIPITLFLNPAFLLKEEIREKGNMDDLLTQKQIEYLTTIYHNITIASHGWNHYNCSKQDISAFEISVNKCSDFFSLNAKYIPFFAYSCGNHTNEEDELLFNKGIIPVYCDGMVNYDNIGIHRECIDGIRI